MIDATTIMKFLSLFAVLFVALSSAEAQTTFPTTSPLAFTGRSGNVSVYSRETNRITCMARGTSATWLGTRQGIKRLDAASGAMRVYSAGEGLPWGTVHSIATDDAGSGAVALVHSTTESGDASLLFCLYSPQSDRWQVLTRLPATRPDWFANMESYTRYHYAGFGSIYHIAISEKYAVLLPYISTEKEPFVSRYDRSTGKVTQSAVPQIITNGDAKFIATNSLVRYRETLYVGTQYGLFSVKINSGETERHSPELDVLRVAASPLQHPLTPSPTLWFTARTRSAGTDHTNRGGDGFLRAYSLAENHTEGDSISLNNVGFEASEKLLRVGEDGFPYVVGDSYFARYEPQTQKWRRFYDDGKDAATETPEEVRQRHNSRFMFHQDTPLAPATVIPNTVAAERAYSDVRFGAEHYYTPNSLHWTQIRFPEWITPDVRASSPQAESKERSELNALPVAEEPYLDLVMDQSIPHLAWSVNIQNNIPLLWKWEVSGEKLPVATLQAEYDGEIQGKSAQEAASLLDTILRKPLGKIPLNIPDLRRVQPNVTGLCRIWQKTTEGNDRDGVIVETKRGPIWLIDINSQSDAYTTWLTQKKQKILEAIDQKPFNYSRPLPLDASVPPLPNIPGQPPVLRLLRDDGGGLFYVLATGSPHLWVYDSQKKSWMQKAILPVSVHHFVARDSKILEQLPVAVFRGQILISSTDGLWGYNQLSTVDEWVPIILPTKFAPADALTMSVVAASRLHLERAVADKQNIFISGRGEKDNDPPFIIRWSKKSQKSTFLTEGNYGIPSLRGDSPLLMNDGETVWCFLRTRRYNREDEGDVGGGYRWDEKTNRFIRVTDETVVAMEADTEGEHNVNLLTRDALVRWYRKTGKTERFPLPTKQTAQVMLQTPQIVFVAAQDRLYAWNNKTQQWRLVTNIPRVSNDARLHLANEKALWLYDGATAVRVMLPAP